MTVTIDPAISLAFSLKANKGAYALLLGSGASRSAGIPTGWEVTLDLVRQLSAATGGEAGVDPEAWFLEKYGRPADYSDLLDQLFKAPAERQQCLKPYFEPTPDEREQGLKAPTAAHHAVADLMVQGYVRVVVTTNFDRLLEQALEAKGVVPVVFANADQVRGMLPLTHQTCCIIKVHGDYLDTRIMNTAAELETYSPEMDALLDRVFDEFGLVVCGWSGVWDPALRAAISRAPSRRFASYWASPIPLEDAAERLSRDRAMTRIPIADADRFFADLSDRLKSLSQLDRPHPLSVQAAVATLKRYLVEDRYRIRLHDLLTDAVDDARARWVAAGVVNDEPQTTTQTIADRIRAYDAATEILVALGYVMGRWARADQTALVVEMLQRIARRDPIDGRFREYWVALSAYPASVVFHAYALGAIEADNMEALGIVASASLVTGRGQPAPIVDGLSAKAVSPQPDDFQDLFGGSRRHTPLSDWIQTLLRPVVAPHTSPKDHFDPYALAFDRLEILIALAYRGVRDRPREWAPFGCWAWRPQNFQTIHDQLKAELESDGANASLMRTGWFADPAAALRALQQVYSFAGRLNLG